MNGSQVDYLRADRMRNSLDDSGGIGLGQQVPLCARRARVGTTQHGVRELFPKLHAWLVESVHAVEATRVCSRDLEEHEQCTHMPGVDALERERHVRATAPSERSRSGATFDVQQLTQVM